MSDLSFLIETQKQVIVDEAYLQKCKKDQSEHDKAFALNNGPTRVLSSRQIKVNTNFMPNRRKPNSPRSYNLKNFSSMRSQTSDVNEQLYKIGMRVDALDQNQKRLQQRFSKQFTNLHNAIYNKKNQYNDLMAELSNIKNQINQSKKVIGHVLNDITAKGK